MNETLVERTMYVLLSGMYPSVSGGIGNIIGCIILSVLATLALYGVYWIVTDTLMRLYTEKDFDGFARFLGVVVCMVFCVVFCGMGWSCRMDYKKEKVGFIMEKMKQDKETMERVEKIKDALAELGKDVERFR